MKSDLAFALEHAGWPALLVTGSGMILRANASAMAVLGTIAEGSTSLAASIWAKENTSSPEVFFAHAERSPARSVLLKFRNKDGLIATFEALICPLTKENQPLFLLQFLAGPPTHLSTPLAVVNPPPPGQSNAPLSSDAGLALQQKLDCALELARTAALDFNNALTGILGHVSLLLSKVEPANPWRASLTEIEKSARQAAETAADLEAFSRQEKEPAPPTGGNLNELVRQTVALFQPPAHPGIVWNLDLKARIYAVTFDEAKLRQGFSKILENAMEAGAGRGVISVHTRNHEFPAVHQDSNVRLDAGRYVCVEIEDSGHGIPADVLPRIFEPFFTTKDRSQHRGLGLTWTYGIVSNHGGSVAVASEPGLGTSVRVYLPALHRVLEDPGGPTEDLTGSGTILLIDDEELLLTAGEMILSAHGYRVITANSGAQALEIFAKAPDQIDLVITDLVMPHMSGSEVIERLRQSAPNLRVLRVSGLMHALRPEEEEASLPKPFTSQDLLRKVKRVLAPASAT